MNPNKIKEIFARFAQAEAQPTTELIYHSPFELLIAVMLSAQMTDAGVNRTTEKLFKVANTPKTILAFGPEKLAEHLKSINYFRTKTKHILATCQQLLEKHQGQVPSQREQLEALPGVGRKTANVVLNVVFGESTLPIDTHIFRVSRRIGLTNATTVTAVEMDLLKKIPKTALPHAHHWLVLHGRYTCTARNPHCAQCIIRDLCEYPDKTS